MGETRWRRFFRICMLVFAASLILAAITSIDFFQADEYFQTIEFASFKLGVTPASALPWEYGAQIRPWLLPSLYFVVAKALGALGVTDGFSVARGFRAMSALASFGSVWLLGRAAETWCPRIDQRSAVLAFACFAFYAPYLAVRTSSETTSAAALTAAVALLARKDRTPYWIVGLLLGLAFELRFQTAIAAIGLVSWVLVHGGARRVRHVVAMVVGVALVIGLGTLVDRWGYGALTFAPANYFRVNLVGGVASHFGERSWAAYLWLPHEHPFAPLSIMIMVFMLIGLVTTRRHVTTWVVVPFVLVHVLIAHKEDRFLFPILPLASFHAAVGASHFERVWRLRDRWFAHALYALNGLILLGFITLPKTFVVVVQKFLRDHRGVPTIATSDPYRIYGLSMWFYRSEPVELVTPTEARAMIAKRTTEVRVVCTDDDRGCDAFSDGEVVHRSLPTWIGVVDVGGWVERTNTWQVIYYRAPTSP